MYKFCQFCENRARDIRRCRAFIFQILVKSQ